MAEPLRRAAFDALVERARLCDMAPEEREDSCLATRHAAGFAERVRTSATAPLGVETEHATVFAPWEPRA
jgi:hypothetical protein